MWNHARRLGVSFIKRRYCTQSNVKASSDKKINSSLFIGVSSYLTSLGILIAADNVIQIHSQETTILSNIKKLNTILSKEEDEKRRKEIEKIIAEVNASPYSPINCSERRNVYINCCYSLICHIFIINLSVLTHNTSPVIFAFPLFPAIVAGLTAKRLFNSKKLFNQLVSRKQSLNYLALKKAAGLTLITTHLSVLATTIMIQATAMLYDKKEKTTSIAHANVALLPSMGGKLGSIYFLAIFLFIPGAIFVAPTYLVTFPAAFLASRRMLKRFISRCI